MTNNTTNNNNVRGVKRSVGNLENEHIAMQLATMIEETTTCSIGFIRNMSIEGIMELENFYHPSICNTIRNYLSRNTEELTDGQTLLLLATLLMKHIYLVNCDTDKMILSGSECSLKRAYGIIRKKCVEYIFRYFDGRDRYIAYEKRGENAITIQTLTGTVRVWSNGHTTYRSGYIIGEEGIALDPSKNCWDILMFLVYTD